MKNRLTGFFWVSYSDLMTTLFFIMLVLYMMSFTVVGSYVNELRDINELLADNSAQLEEIKSVEKALENMDERYFDYDPEKKRYRINTDIRFLPNSANILDIPTDTRKELLAAGNHLYQRVSEIIKKNPSINYLLIIEGNAARSNNNWKVNPEAGYRLSYNRALSLFYFWKNNGIDFTEIGNQQCEVIIAGSGHFGFSREEDERQNRRFSIQVTSKVGMFLNQNEDGS